VHPDPLEFLYRYGSVRDREVVGLVSSCLAYGKVSLILRSVDSVLGEMGPSPYEFVTGSADPALRRAFAGFKHRFTTGEELGRLLVGVKRALGEHGSLNACFNAGLRRSDDTVVRALGEFTASLAGLSDQPCLFLLPDPARGSACKRLNLFLRWLVRKDRVDPGGWKGVSRSKLVVPLDTHMFKVGRELGFTSRRSADLKAALEITAGFRGIVPGDPVRYDFALTRLGIRDDASFEGFLSEVDQAQC
jgi:uncharacterized protein (TIGR02757 family)